MVLYKDDDGLTLETSLDSCQFNSDQKIRYQTYPTSQVSDLTSCPFFQPASTPEPNK